MRSKSCKSALHFFCPMICTSKAWHYTLTKKLPADACFTQSMRRIIILFVFLLFLDLIVSSRWRQEQAFFRWVKTFFWTNCGWRGRRTTPAAQLSCLISCISSNLTLIDFVIELSTISLIPFSLLWLDLARLPMLDQQQQLHFFQSSQQDHHQVVK